MGPAPTLSTSTLRLRRITDRDLENIFLGLSHPEVVRYYGVRYDTLEATQAQMKYYAELEENGTGYWWAICNPADTVFYGAAGIYQINPVHLKAEIGFWLLPDYWGKGIMKEVMTILCQFSFDTLSLHRLEALVETDNVNCVKALEKFGFHLEGTMVDCEWKDDRWISLHIYALMGNRFLKSP
jgi:ribosomal-protein-alanine N-acetyltransferase